MKAAPLELLVVSPDREASRLLCRTLESGGYRTLCAASPAEARRVIGHHGWPRLVLLTLPGDDPDAALQLCRQIHDLADVPVLVIVDYDLREQPPWLLEDYIEDLIVSPASPDETLIRVRRLLRRADSGHSASGDAGYSASSGPGRLSLTTGGHTVVLSDREAALFDLLQRHENRVLTTDYLLRQVWSDGAVGEVTLRVTIHRLRQKIERLPGRNDRILSVRGRGYIYSAGAPVAAHPV